MNLLALSTLLLSFPRFTPGKPVQGIQGHKATGETYLHQDDIVYRRRTQRSAMKCNQRCVWPRSKDGLVNIPINVSTEFSVEERAVIAEAMQEFVTLTCIQFIRRSTEHDYINIFPADRCWSYFGKIGGKQQLGLAKNGCIYKGLIQHEINHALGFIHEQARNDRDKYVKIHLEYVIAGEQGNFEKVDSNNLGLPYDYGSVMHYGPYDFSSAPGKATIVPIPNASVPIGQRIGLSDLDVKKINKLYRCNCCSTVLRNRRGNFSSDNYPYPYPQNVTCLWLIQIPVGKVFLKFWVLDLQRSPNCASDYIRIYDGNNRNARILVDKLCGVGQLPAVVSSGSMMLVEFVSDETAAASKGFTASYAYVICGGTFTSTRGVVTSPNFPRKYPPNKKCLWIISAPAGSRISLTMGSFDLEEATRCNYDRLVFRDGSDISSPLLGTFCGKTEVPAFNSTGSFLRIEFYSDIVFQYSGFKLDYSIILPS